MMGRNTSLLILLATIWGAALLSSGQQPTSSQSPESAELSAEISVPPEVRVTDGWISAGLIVKNLSMQPVRICVLVGGSRHIGKGKYEENFRPDWWKSDRPRPEKFWDKMVVLNPNETFTFPIKIHYEYSIEFFRGLPLTISASYSTDKEFATQYRTWEGSVQAKPVTVTVVE